MFLRIRSRWLISFLWFICLAFVVFYSGCLTSAPNWGTVNGTIVDTSYNPISGATASIDDTSGDTLSDGTFSMTRVTNGTKIITLTQSGYTTSYRQVTVAGGSTAYANLAILAPLDSKVTEIDSSGGTVSNTDGSLQLSIPSGALSSSKQIQLTQVPLSAAPYPPPTGYQFIAVIVYVTPTNTTLSEDAILTIPNSTGLADGTNVSFYAFNSSSLEWQLMTSTAEAHATSNTITANVNQFGWLAAIIPISPSAGNITGTITDSSTGSPIPYASVWSSYFSTVADENGEYTLTSLPTGEVSVEAIAAGYYRGTENVTVTGGSTVTCNLALSARTSGTIYGHVYRASDTVPISGARVSGPSGIETTTNSSGFYTLYNVPAGSAQVYAYANGYMFNSGSGTVFGGGTTTIEVYLTRTTEATGWTDDFETDRNWTNSYAFATTLWQRTFSDYALYRRDTLAPVYVSLADYDSTLGRLPLPHSGSYYYWYGQAESSDAQGCYVAVQKTGDSDLSGGTSDSSYPYNYGYLISPSIDISGFAYATLSFWTWWEVEGVNAATGYDQMNVQISTNGGSTYSNLAVLNPFSDPNTSREAFRPYSSGGYNLAGRWVKHSFDLTPYVGNVIKIRFYFNTVDELYNGFRGWIIDDFSVSPEAISSSSVSSAAVTRRADGGILRIQAR